MIAPWAEISELADPTHPLATEMIQSASWILYKLTAEKYPGILVAREAYASNDFSTKVAPVLISGKMVNLPVTSSVGNKRELYVRHKPVHRLISVEVNGVVQPLSNYQLRNHSFIIKKDRTLWNFHANTEVVIEYEYGTNPPPMGMRAAVRLADELILAVENDPECAIPANVTSVNRQGYSFQMTDPQTFIDQGRTGIREVDMFIIASNPKGSSKPAKFYSPNRIIGETIQ